MRILAILVGLVILAADLATKAWVTASTAVPFTVIEGFFDIHYVNNRGIAFGLFHSLESTWKTSVLSSLALLALLAVLYYLWITPISERLSLLSFGLLLGGISGNFVDRLRHGYVVDFLELHLGDAFTWPTFNIADAAITTGVFLILLETWRQTRPAQDQVPRSSGGESARLCVFFFVVASSFGLTLAPTEGELEALVERFQERYASVKSIKADFRQVYRDRFTSHEESGVLWMKRPGKMYWKYLQPKLKHFVADGQQTYFYIPSKKQLYVSDFQVESDDNPLLLLIGTQKIGDLFNVSAERDESPVETANWLLRLEPMEPRGEFDHLILELDAKDYSVRRLAVIEHIGARSDYILEQVQENLRIPEKTFRLQTPKDTRIIYE